MSHEDGDQQQDSSGQSNGQGACPLGEGVAVAEADADDVHDSNDGEHLAGIDHDRVHEIPERDVGNRQLDPGSKPYSEQGKYPWNRALPERVAGIAQDEWDPESEPDDDAGDYLT